MLKLGRSLSRLAAGRSLQPSQVGTAALIQSRAAGTQAYHAGLVHTEFASKLEISKDSQVIPIFRVMNYQGEILDGWELPFSKEALKEKLQFMIRLSVWDDMLYNVQRQGRISFYIQNVGEEAAQTGSGSALSIDDHLFCQYRELGVLMWRGFSLQDACNQCFSTSDEEGKGRQMPISYTKRGINLHTICTPLTTQVPHAAGAGYAFKINGDKKCAVAYFGEGAASEGDFHAALNFASVTKAQTIFICKNNGYAISTPVVDQYAGDGIAIRGKAYGMQTVRVDGNDLLAVHLATKAAREICIKNSEPVLMEFMTYRMGHHSTSDDSSLYRPEGEFDAWNQPGINPIARVRNLVSSYGMWSEAEEEELRKEAKKELLAVMKNTEKIKRAPVIEGIFDDVYDKMPLHIKEQAEGLAAHLKKYGSHYDLSTYAKGNWM